LILFVAAIPALVSVLMVTVYGQKNFLDFIPFWNDEVNYWHETKTFVEVGFEGGYYTVIERPPAASFTHFYTHGPWYPLIYGGIGKLIGWQLYTGVILNLVIVGLGLILFCWMARLNNWQITATGVVALTFWPMTLYWITNMQEATQHFIAILGAAVFYVVITRQAGLSRRTQIAFIGFLFFSAVMRPSWAILFLPYFLFTGRRTFSGTAIAFAKTLIFTAAALLINSYVGAPGNNSVFAVLSAFSNGIGAGLQAVWVQISTNFRDYVALLQINPLDTMLLLQVAGTIGITAVIVVIVWLRKPTSTMLQENILHVLNLVLIILACFVLYLANGYFKTVSLHLLLSLLVMIAFKRWRVAALIIIVNILWISPFLSMYQAWTAWHFPPGHQAIETFQAQTASVMAYQPGVDPWCNTLLFHVDKYLPELNGAPAGIGLSFYFGDDLPMLEFKSRYILLTAAEIDFLSYLPDPPELSLIAETNLGRLYLNLDSACPLQLPPNES
jgi:hypothetical protein